MIPGAAEMIIANRGPIEPLQGFEAVGRAVRLVLAGGLNDEIDRQQQRWLQADELFETAGFDAGLRAAGIDHVATDNIFGGPHKSLVASPLGRFPNVSVTAYAARAAPSNSLNDRMKAIEVTMLVETMVYAGPRTDDNALFVESLVHRRIERTSEAVIACIERSRTLLGTVDHVPQPSGGLVNASWTRTEDTEGASGAIYVLHGSRFQYALTRRVAIDY